MRSNPLLLTILILVVVLFFSACKAFSSDSRILLAQEEAQVLFKSKDYDAVIKAYGELLKLDPDFAEAYYWTGVSFHRLDKYDEAIANMEIYMEMNPEGEFKRKALGVIADSYRMKEMIKEMFEIYNKISPWIVRALVFVSVVFMFLVTSLILGVTYLITSIVKKTRIRKSVFVPDDEIWQFKDIVKVVIVWIIMTVTVTYLLGKTFYGDGLAGLFYNIKYPMLLFSSYLLTTPVLCFLPIYFVVKKYKLGLKDIGFKFKNFPVIFFAGFVGGIVIVFLGAYAGRLVEFIMRKPIPNINPVGQLASMAETFQELKIPLVLGAVIAPVMEEVFYRGFVYNLLKRYTGIVAAVLISALFFALMHFHLMVMFPLLIMGIGLAFLYEKTGSIFAPMIAHFLINMLFIFGLYYEPVAAV